MTDVGLCGATVTPNSTHVSSTIFKDFAYSSDPGGPKKKMKSSE